METSPTPTATIKGQHDYAFTFTQTIMNDLVSRLAKFEDRILCRSWVPYFFDNSIDTSTMGHIPNSEAFYNLSAILQSTMAELKAKNPTWIYGETGNHDVGDTIKCTHHAMLDVLYRLDVRARLLVSILGKRKEPEPTTDPAVPADDPMADDPPVVADDPPVVADDPPIVVDDPPVVTDDPPVVTDDPPVDTAQP